STRNVSVGTIATCASLAASRRTSAAAGARKSSGARPLRLKVEVTALARSLTSTEAGRTAPRFLATRRLARARGAGPTGLRRTRRPFEKYDRPVMPVMKLRSYSPPLGPEVSQLSARLLTVDEGSTSRQSLPMGWGLVDGRSGHTFLTSAT